MTSLWRHFMILGFDISIFCETGYMLPTCQLSNPSVIWIKFYRGFYRTPKKTLWRHYDVTSQYLAFKIAHFVELNKRYQPAEFYWPRLSGSNFMRAGGKHPLPQTYTLSKSPVLIGLKPENLSQACYFILHKILIFCSEDILIRILSMPL